MAFILLTTLIIFASYHPVFGLKGYESTTLIVFLSLVFLLSSFIHFRTQNTERRLLSPISFFLILFLGWAVLGHFYTVDQDHSMDAILQHFGGIVTLLGLSFYIREEKYLQWFLGVVLFCAGLMSTIAIIQQFAFYKEITQSWIPWSTGLYGHKNILATYLLLHLPISIYFCFSSKTINKKIITAILSILIVLALIFTRSRGGQLVLGSQLFCILIYIVLKKDHTKLKNLFIGGGVTATLYWGLLFLTKTTYYEPAQQLPPSILDVYTGQLNAWTSLDSRLVYWQTGWGIFKDYWLTGTGPWTFELLFPVYLGKETSRLVEGFVYSINPPHSHNIFVQIATDTGVIGLGLFMVFLIAVYSRGIYLLRNVPPETRNLVFFLLLSVTGFMIHNQIEYNWIQKHFIYPFIFLVFALDFLDRKYNPRKNSVNKINSLIYNAALTAFVLLVTLSTMSYYKYQALIYEKIIPSTGVANLRVLTNEAKTYCPGCGWPGLEMTKNLISQYRLTPNPIILESAEIELKEVARLSPFNYRYLVYLAEVRNFQKNWDEAKELYVQAFKNIKAKDLGACRLLSSNPDQC